MIMFLVIYCFFNSVFILTLSNSSGYYFKMSSYTRTKRLSNIYSKRNNPQIKKCILYHELKNCNISDLFKFFTKYKLTYN